MRNEDDWLMKAAKRNHPAYKKKRSTLQSAMLMLCVFMGLIPTFWLFGWFSLSTLKEEWGIPFGIIFIVTVAWLSGYKYGIARGWAEIELRMLPRKEREHRGYYLRDDECLHQPPAVKSDIQD